MDEGGALVAYGRGWLPKSWAGVVHAVMLVPTLHLRWNPFARHQEHKVPMHNNLPG